MLRLLLLLVLLLLPHNLIPSRRATTHASGWLHTAQVLAELFCLPSTAGCGRSVYDDDYDNVGDDGGGGCYGGDGDDDDRETRFLGVFVTRELQQPRRTELAARTSFEIFFTSPASVQNNDGCRFGCVLLLWIIFSTRRDYSHK